MLSVIIPAMNEAGTIRPVLSDYVRALRASGAPFEIVVVNDVAADNTAEVLEGLAGEFPEVHAFNRRGKSGYGTAVSTGIDLAKGEFVVISSADACNSSENILDYYRALEEGNDAVFGSRFMRGGSVTGYPAFKLWINRFSNWMLMLLFGFRFNDYTDGFKGYRRTLLDQFKPLFAHKFNITIELSLKAVLLTDRIKQVPTQWSGRNWGQSKMSILRVLRYYVSSLLFVLGLKVVGDEYRRAARQKAVIDPVHPRAPSR